ncbi:MAG: tRNA uridine-5-carboxymethylaminomethyl(34) synthesis GTPase MnmE [Mycoplasma sp.]
MLEKIISLSSAPFKGAIAIIRMSGDDCISAFQSLFSNKEKLEHGRFYYGKIINNQEIIDEVIALIYKKPNSFTGEEMVEINCHGSLYVVDQIISLFIQNGFRQANKGEFTLRAFLNNKINLIQAESINDLVNSRNEISRKISINNLVNKADNKIKIIKEKILNLITDIEVKIDYPEYYDIIEKLHEELKNNLLIIIKELQVIESKSILSQPLLNGIKTAIIGKPNVGKSSLLNCLIKEDKAIVSHIPGTTRDYVEGEVLINDILLKIIDTAGIRKTKNLLEKQGIERSIKIAQHADIVIFLIDSELEKISSEEKKIISNIDKNKIIFVRNKKDLLSVREDFNTPFISTKNNDIEELVNILVKKFKNFQINSSDLVLTNVRQISYIKSLSKSLKLINKMLDEKQNLELISLELQKTLLFINELLGEDYSEEIITNLFKNYCLGK